jgi:RHS repeat-associated protein
VVLSDAGEIKYQKYLDPWGNLEMEIGEPSSNIEFQYTDKELDEDTDLYYFQARYYDPVRGGFPSRDRVKLEDNLKNYFGINAYLFTNNNPIRNVDEDGNTPAEVMYFAQPHRWAEYPVALSVREEVIKETREYIRSKYKTVDEQNAAIANPASYEDNDVDARRHALLTIRLRQELGDEAARNILNNHENDPFNGQGATKEQHEFDLYNNGVALSIKLDKNVEDPKAYASQLATDLLQQGKLQTTLPNKIK